MECIINGKAFAFNKNIKADPKCRLLFNALSQKTFGLSFENWYNAGFWTDQYQPYTLSDGGKVVANVSVNIIDTVWQDVPKKYIQLGTVMTDPDYRDMGLSKYLMDRVFEDWLDHCDAMYLYANDSVLDFYPRFGFVKAEEYHIGLHIAPRTASVRKLDMASKGDIAMLHDYYQKSNPFAELPMVDNWGLLMFYCSAFMKDCVYYVEDCQAVVIAAQEEDMLTVFDIYCDPGSRPTDVISAIIGDRSTCQQVQLGFSLKDASEDSLSLRQEEDTTLFLLDGKENVFKNHKTMFPLLSHA